MAKCLGVQRMSNMTTHIYLSPVGSYFAAKFGEIINWYGRGKSIHLPTPILS